MKGREIFAEWQDGGCTEPWCDMYSPVGYNATRRGHGTDASSPGLAWPVVVFYAALRLGCATAALIFFFRVRAPGGRGNGGGGGGGAGVGRSALMRSAVSHTHYSTLAGSSIFTDANSSLDGNSLDPDGGHTFSSEGNSSVNGLHQVEPITAVRGAEIIFLAGMEQGAAGGGEGLAR